MPGKKNDDPQLFAEAIQKSKKGNYLGEIAVVNQLLRLYASNLMDQLNNNDKKSWIKEIERQSNSLSRILIGKSKYFQSANRWNEPGGIDEFCKTYFGATDKNPQDRVKNVVLQFFEELIDIALYAEIEGVLEEQWGFQVDAVIEKYALAFIGVSPGEQLAMEVN